MSDLDNYEPALDADTGSDAGDDTTTVGDSAEGSAIETREVVRDRGVKDTTRKLFQDAAQKLKKQLDDGDSMDDLEPAITDEPSAAAAASSASTPDASKEPHTPAAAAPTSDPVAQAVDTSRAAQVELREKQLEDREKAIAAREDAIAARENGGERYIENPGAFIRDLIKQYTGATTDDELRDEIADLVTDLSSTVLGAQVPESHKLRLDSKRAVRQVKAYKAEQAKRDAEMAKKAEQTARERDAQQAMRAIGHELERVKDKFPHLAAEDDPGAIVWAVIQTKHQQDGSVPNWEECARLAEEHFKKKSDAWIAKRRHLLAPAAPQAPVAASAPQGDPQSRRSSTLTNKTAAPVPPAPPDEDGEWDRDAHRRRSLSKLREPMKERTT